MNTRHKILPAVCCIALMSACASNQSTSAAPWSVKPAPVAKNSNDKPEALYQIGRYYQGQNRYDQAIEAYMKALKADPGFVEARNGLGVIYSRQGRYQEAIEAFQAAIVQAPKAAHLYSNMGYAYYLQGQYADSVKALEQATLLDPGNQRALNNLGQAYAKAGNATESVRAFSGAANVTAEAPTAAVKETVQPVQAAAENTTQLVAAATADASIVKLAPKAEAELMVIPKDRGVIRMAAQSDIPVVDSRVKLVNVAPHVSELQVARYITEAPQIVAQMTAQPQTKVKIEVANGNGVAGAAGRLGKYLRFQGSFAARLTNQKPYKTQTTQIQYRQGYEVDALFLQSKLIDAPEMVLRNDLRAGVGIRLVLGKDIVPTLASYDLKNKKTQLALNSSLR